MLSPLKKYIRERGIEKVFHFTPLNHLIEIATCGQLISRASLESSEGWAEDFLLDFLSPPDQQRLDELSSYINTSITKPNIFLLRDFRRRIEHIVEHWAILEFDSVVLEQRGTLFAVTNAASHAARHYRIQEGVAGLKNVFRDEVINGKYHWKRNGKEQNEPTDIQAEALIPGPINLTAMRALHFEDVNSMRLAISALKTIGAPSHEELAKITPELFR